jgi:hypothetical protein
VLIILLFAACQAGHQGTMIRWENGPPPQNEYAYHGCVTDDGFVYTVGGFNGGAFECYEIHSGQWHSLPDLPEPRVFSAVVLADGNIYVIGGMDSLLQSSPVVQRFDIKRKVWSSISPLPAPRNRLCAVTLDGRIYVAGGMEGEDDRHSVNVNNLEVYDPEAGAWKALSPMPTKRHGLSAAVFGGKIIAMGGYTDQGPTDAVDLYDPLSNTWTVSAPMPTARGFFGIAQYKDRIIAIAGRVPGDNGPVEIFFPAENKWVKNPPFAGHNYRFGMTSGGSKIFMVGGEESPKTFQIGLVSEK